MNKTEYFDPNNKKTSLSGICKTLGETLSDYNLSIEEFYNLTPRKITRLLNDLFIMHLMPKWDDIVKACDDGRLEEHEIKFICRLKHISDQFVDDMQFIRNQAFVKKSKKLAKETNY